MPKAPPRHVTGGPGSTNIPDPQITSALGFYPVTGTAPVGSRVLVRSMGAAIATITPASDGTWSYSPPAGTKSLLTFHTQVTVESEHGSDLQVSLGIDWHAWIATPTLHADACVVAPGSTVAHVKLWLGHPTTGEPITAEDVVLPVNFRIRIPNDSAGGLQGGVNVFGPPAGRVHHIRVGDDPVIYVPVQIADGAAIAGRYAVVVVEGVMGCSTPELHYGGALPNVTITVAEGGTAQNAPPATFHRPRWRIAPGTPSYEEDIANFRAGPAGVIDGVPGGWADDNNAYGNPIQSVRSVNTQFPLAGYGSDTIAGMDGPTVTTDGGQPAIALITRKLPTQVQLNGYSGPFNASYQATIMEGRFKPELCHRYGRWDVVARWPDRRASWGNYWHSLTRIVNGVPTGEFIWPFEIDTSETPKHATYGSPGDQNMSNLHIGVPGSKQRDAETFDQRNMTLDGYPLGFDLTTQYHEMSLVITPPAGNQPSRIIRLIDGVEFNSAENLFDGSLGDDLVWFPMLGVDLTDGNSDYADGNGTAFIRSFRYTPPEALGAITDVPPGVIDLGFYNPQPQPPTLSGAVGDGKITWSWADHPQGAPGATHRLYNGSTLVHTFTANEPTWEETLPNGTPATRTLKAVGVNGLVSDASAPVSKTPQGAVSLKIADGFNRPDQSGLGSTPTGDVPWVQNAGTSHITSNHGVIDSGSGVTLDLRGKVFGDFDISVGLSMFPSLYIGTQDNSSHIIWSGTDAQASTGAGHVDYSNLYGAEHVLRTVRVGDHFKLYLDGTLIREFDQAFPVLDQIAVFPQYGPGYMTSVSVTA